MPYKWKSDKKKYQQKYHAEWYEKNKKTARQRMADRKQEIKDWFFDFKGTLKCARCDESHPATLDFHHLDEKNELVSKLVNEGASKERIIAEIALCEVVCSNCHRKEHWNHRGTKPS